MKLGDEQTFLTIAVSLITSILEAKVQSFWLSSCRTEDSDSFEERLVYN